jgi:protein involved in polysaccharide export with SLBB domain
MRYATIAVALSAVGLFVLVRQDFRREPPPLNAEPLPAEHPAPAPARAESQPTPAVPPEPSRVPPYVIEPCDPLIIEAGVRDPRTNKLAPLPIQHISGLFGVRRDGKLQLGYWDSVHVAGMTVDQAREAVRRHLAASEALKVVTGEGGTLEVTLDELTYNGRPD